MSKSIKKNYIYNLVYQTLIVLTPLITTPYISRVIGANGVGRVSFVESIVSYFVLFAALGATTYGQREISYYRDDIKKRSLVFFNVYLFKLIIATIALIIYFLLCLFVFRSYIYIIFSINIIAVLVDATWFFQGLEEFKIIAIRNIIFKLLSIIYVFLYVKSGDDIIKYCISLTLFTFLANLSLIPYLSGKIVKVSFDELKPFSNLKTIISLFLPTIAIQIYTILDKTMIGIITHDNLQNGYYEQAMKLSKFPLFIVTALSTVIIPRIGYYYNIKDDKNLKKLMYDSYSFTMLLAVPITLGLFAISSNLVPWFLGNEFMPSILLVRILSFLIIAIGISNLTGLQYMVPTGRQNMLTLSVTLGAIINFVLNIFLIRVYKSVGASIASVIAEFSITFIQLYLVRSEISFVDILRKSKKYIISSVLMYIILFFISRKMISTCYNTLILITIGAIIYFTTLIILRDNFIISFLKKYR